MSLQTNNLKCLSNKMFYDNFSYFILNDAISEVQFLCSKLDMFCLNFMLPKKCM